VGLSSSAAGLTVRAAVLADLPGIGNVFLAAFPESVLHYTGRHSTHNWREGRLIWQGGRRLMADVFAVCLAAEPPALIVAEEQATRRIAGYIFAPAALSRLGPAALRGGLWRLGLGWLRGRYKLGIAAVAIALRNAVHNLLDLRREVGSHLASEARIFSVAVHPDYQGQGLGSSLTSAGMAYLRGQGATKVRLEVRPSNAAAIRVYMKLGFTVAGETRDSQGPWLVMIATLDSQRSASS